MSITVERSTLSNNGADGFLANAASTYVAANVVRNTIQNNALEGVEILGQSASAYVFATVAENAFTRNGHNGIRCTGGNVAYVTAGRNVFADDAGDSIAQAGRCSAFSTKDNFGKNYTSGTIVTTGTLF